MSWKPTLKYCLYQSDGKSISCGRKVNTIEYLTTVKSSHKLWLCECSILWYSLQNCKNPVMKRPQSCLREVIKDTNKSGLTFFIREGDLLTEPWLVQINGQTSRRQMRYILKQYSHSPIQVFTTHYLDIFYDRASINTSQIRERCPEGLSVRTRLCGIMKLAP